MILLQPTAITPTTLTTSNVDEVAPAAWASGTTYAAGTEASVSNATTGAVDIYASLTSGNVGNPLAHSGHVELT